jgi:hypothetical protein
VKGAFCIAPSPRRALLIAWRLFGAT